MVNGKMMIIILIITINMLKEKKINSMVFVEQTTFYVYHNEEDRKEDKPCMVTSDKWTFNRLKKNALKRNKNEQSK